MSKNCKIYCRFDDIVWDKQYVLTNIQPSESSTYDGVFGRAFTNSVYFAFGRYAVMFADA